LVNSGHLLSMALSGSARNSTTVPAFVDTNVASRVPGRNKPNVLISPPG